MHLQPARVDRLWDAAALIFAQRRRNRLSLLAICLVWFAAAPASALTLTGVSANATCDVITGVTVTGSGAATVTDGAGILIARISASSPAFIPFEQPADNTQWTVNDGTAVVVVPSTLAPQCAPPSLTVAEAAFNARIMQGGVGAPPTGTFTVSNAGGSAVYLAATPSFPGGVPFFTLSALPTTLGPQASSALTVTLNAAAFSLPRGRYMANIYFSNAADLSLVTRQVLLTVVDSVAHDFNGDGFSDLLWRDAAGDLGIWLMHGAAAITTGGLGPLSPSWSIVAQRDFDDNAKADWLGHNTNGNVQIWFMNGTQISSSAIVGNVATSWTIIAAGDFDGDGKADILWRDTSGDIAIWFMNGAQVVSSAGIGNVPTNWSVVGTGDFNADFITDLLWQDNLGNVAVWLMNGTQVAAAAGLGLVPPPWQMAGTGDFDGNGTSDLLWRDSSGNTGIWLMSATSATGVPVGNIATVWSVAETGDFNGDGYSDIFWRDTDGNTATWFMNGASVISTASVAPVATIWTLQTAGAE